MSLREREREEEREYVGGCERARQGLNFINVLCTAFSPADPESIKRY